jgi:hypothetical protein
VSLEIGVEECCIRSRCELVHERRFRLTLDLEPKLLSKSNSTPETWRDCWNLQCWGERGRRERKGERREGEEKRRRLINRMSIVSVIETKIGSVRHAASKLSWSKSMLNLT